MSKYNIPAEYERYNDIVDNLVDKYTTLIEEDLATFESDDLMVLIGLIGKSLQDLRNVVDDIKEIPDTDKIQLYTLLLALVIEKSVLASDKLTEGKKEHVRNTFGENGIFQSLLGMFQSWFNRKLVEMDTNKDKKVTRQEYVEYLFRQNKKNCPCAGDASNRRAAECSANCCFPFLSGGDGVIDLKGEDESDRDNEGDM